MSRQIIDFHTHPFLRAADSACMYKEGCPADWLQAGEYLRQLGVQTICGSVVGPGESWAQIARLNEQALQLREHYGEFYVPGFHIHPDYIEDSLAEIERMAGLGVTLMGELVPYMHKWKLSHPGIVPLLAAAERYGMVVNFHSTNVADEVIEPLLAQFPGLTFVAAHPGEPESFARHLGRMKRFENYYLDLSGGGLGRMGLLRRGIDRVGKERFLFGTDFPVCPPAMYVGVVESDPFLTEEEKNAVFFENAQRILKRGAME